MSAAANLVLDGEMERTTEWVELFFVFVSPILITVRGEL